MNERKKRNWIRLIILIVIPLAVGMLSSFVTGDSMTMYKDYNQPPFSPPSLLFPIMWTILYILMGISAYLVTGPEVPARQKSAALTIFAVQLVVNFFWSPLFFKMGLVLISFFWIVMLWILVLIMILVFRRISKAAAWLQLPYIIWLTIAAYLNLGIFLLN
ncbi:TspO/MBR family protein [Candidatus Methanomassiliicoccus intestinalis]|jgi:hypothetical protein|uniref:Tryptophan-rich sensory protein n=1 Tax=Methanomassiliicoccus intestinalis (strain Issoire-Mx1) TaxID=1295009 RepID=R9TBR9_METII|nr:TspO/MBR family protein [Candidatus Methanomassiliicoccus intestinalis]AGN26898.1 hypothetical protein MMINT_15905 [Candidatus Methanomassiliicoccus intestinalis Issoire-Mx1]TQS83872.1 MAG: hypothetical protein A3206_03325 [Candidatus Methanomassiliicoccus intestinalis]